jgi:hypothetical protein
MLRIHFHPAHGVPAAIPVSGKHLKNLSAPATAKHPLTIDVKDTT